uniref:Uncharacterized protein n=1 Tax=Candidatus Kentrum sp. UNK TaxID=2126344 RepID=A0A451B690_9GAMM|nr:MAG: hypothetical protein BECKUNK1418H_GA0071006_12943 [Candidatus Kentron sp. UNK]
MIFQPKTLFETASELVHAITGGSVVIWIKDFQTGVVSVRGRAGLDDSSLGVDTAADKDGTGVIGKVMANGSEHIAPNIR